MVVEWLASWSKTGILTGVDTPYVYSLFVDENGTMYAGTSAGVWSWTALRGLK